VGSVATWHGDFLMNQERTARYGQVIWLTGLSAAGKTTLGNALCLHLRALGYRVDQLDGDEVRRGLSSDLGFSAADRDENVRRIGQAAHALALQGNIVIVSAMSPFRQARATLREFIPNLIEVYVNATLEVCEKRDRKKLYQRARVGLLSDVPGVNLPYEAPHHPQIECRTDRETVEESLEKILVYLLPVLRDCHAEPASRKWRSCKAMTVYRTKVGA
jgi:adenylyl-sulfate kinase